MPEEVVQPVEKPAGFENAKLIASITSATPEVKPEWAEEPAKVVEQPPVVDDYWKKLSEKVGTQYENEDQIVEELKSRRDLEKQITEYQTKLKPYESLNPIALDIDKALKAGIDLNLYLEAKDLDPDKLETQDLLRKKFVREYPGLSKDATNTLFKEYYDTNFGILGQKFDEAEALANQPKVELAKARLELETQSAKRFLSDWKQKHVTIPDPKVEEVNYEQKVQEYNTQADAFVDEIDVIGINVGDGQFQFGLEGYKESLRNDLRNPVETLKRHGVDLEKGTIDPTKLAELLLAYRAIGDIGKPLSDWSIEQKNAQFVKQEIQQPAPTQPISGGAQPVKGWEEKLADQIEADRERKRISTR